MGGYEVNRHPKTPGPAPSLSGRTAIFSKKDYLFLGAAVMAIGLVVGGINAFSQPVTKAGPSQLTAVKSTATPGPVSQVFWVEQLADGLNAPWSMAWLPNGDQLIVEKFGGIRIMRRGKLDPKPIAGAPKAYQAAQSGLHDIVLDPEFARNRIVYLSYAEGDYNANRGAVYRARFTGSALVDGKVIFRSIPDKMRPSPIAGRLLFLPDKTLLVSVMDDHSHKHLVQQTDNHFGKLIRINRDGTIPRDNPFVNRPGYLPGIYSGGHRTILGLVRDPKDGTIWEVENGPQGGDEVNIIKKGGNAGWPLFTYGLDYSGQPLSDAQEGPGYESPIFYWNPSVAPSGIAVYRGGRYPGWDGDLFVGTLRGKSLRHIRMQNRRPVGEEVLLADLNERIRDVRAGPDGLIYVLTDNTQGRMLRLRPGRPAPADLPRVAKPFVATPGPRTPGDPQEVVADSAGDPVVGRKLFEERCSSCHAVERNAEAMPGPNLFGIEGRRYGSLPNFPYSPGLKMANAYWNISTLGQFLANPASFMPGTTMAIPGMPDVTQRRDLIAYIVQAGKPPQGEAPPAPNR